MTHKIGLVARDVVDAAVLGLPYAKAGHAVRIFTPQADVAGLPARLEKVRTDVAILVTSGDGESEAQATAALQRWGAAIRPADAPVEGEAAVPFDPLTGVDLRHPGGTLVVSGAVAPAARAQLEQLADSGALVLTLHRDTVLNQDESFLMGIRSGAGVAAVHGRDVVVRSENWPEALLVTRKLAEKRWISADALERRVRLMLARVAQGVVLEAKCTRKLIAVGRETSAAVCEQLAITELVVVAEVAPGLPAMLAPGPQPFLLVVKAGAGQGPAALVQAVAGLTHLTQA